MKLRIISVLLMLALLIPIITSCGDNGADTESTKTTESVTNSDSESSGKETSPIGDSTDTEPSVKVEDTLNMDFDYGGTDFNVLVASVPTRTPDDFKYSDDLGTVMDEAKFRRNQLMLDEYGVNIVSYTDLHANNQGYETIMKDHLAQENSYQLCVLCGYDAAELALQGCLFDFKDLPNVNTSNTWWDQAAERDLSIAGSLFFTTGAISTVIDDYTYCVIYNKDLYKATAEDPQNIYQIVKDGKWTRDKLAELSKYMKENADGNDTMDSHDRYGLMIWDNEMIASINAAGHKIATVQEDGLVKLTIMNDTVNEVVSKFVTMGNSDYCINFQHSTGGVQFYDIFTDNRAVFFMSMFNEVSRFRNMMTDYGIVPNPKLTEDAPYYAPISPWHSAFLCVPMIIENDDSISNVIELLGYHSEKIITPAYYEKTLIGKYVRDDESVGMLDLIFKNRVYDVGHLYRIGTLQEHVTNLLRNNQPGGLSGMYETYSKVANTDIRELNLSITILKNRQEESN